MLTNTKSSALSVFEFDKCLIDELCTKDVTLAQADCNQGDGSCEDELHFYPCHHKALESIVLKQNTEQDCPGHCLVYNSNENSMRSMACTSVSVDHTCE